MDSPTGDTRRTDMATAKKQTSRGRNQDRKLVAGGQAHEVKYEAKKTGATTGEVKAAVKKVGNSRKKVDEELDE